MYTYTHRPNTGINLELISSHSTELFEAVDEGERRQLYDLIKQIEKRICSLNSFQGNWLWTYIYK